MEMWQNCVQCMLETVLYLPFDGLDVDGALMGHCRCGQRTLNDHRIKVSIVPYIDWKLTVESESSSEDNADMSPFGRPASHVSSFSSSMRWKRVSFGWRRVILVEAGNGGRASIGSNNACRISSASACVHRNRNEKGHPSCGTRIRIACRCLHTPCPAWKSRHSQAPQPYTLSRTI